MSTVTREITGSYLMPALEHATVADAMHPGLLTYDRGTPLTDLARMMATKHVHCIAVTDERGHDGASICGIVSDLDLVQAGLRGGAEPTAGEIAHPSPVTVESTLALREAAGLMVEQDATHLIVTEPTTGRPVGVLSTLDVAGILAWGQA